MEKWQYNSYLTEEKLGNFLSSFFITHSQYKINGLKVDYYFEHNNKKYTVEFDGYYHFSSSKTQTRDLKLKKYCEENSIQLISFPYFIQLNDVTFYVLFGKELWMYIKSILGDEWTASYDKYKNGFIDSKAMLPWDFNFYGYQKFIGVYNEFIKEDIWSVATEIFESLANKPPNSIFESFILDNEMLPENFLDYYPT